MEQRQDEDEVDSMMDHKPMRKKKVEFAQMRLLLEREVVHYVKQDGQEQELKLILLQIL